MVIDRIHSQTSRGQPSSIQSCVTKVSRRRHHHRSLNNQHERPKTKEAQSNTMIHATIRAPTDTHASNNKILSSQNYQDQWMQRSGTYSSDEYTTRAIRSIIVSKICRHDGSLTQSSRNILKSVDSKVSKIDDFEREHSHGTIFEVKRSLSRSPRVTPHEDTIFRDHSIIKTEDECPDWTNFENNSHQSLKKKKRNKCSRRRVGALLAIVLLLLLTIAAILLALLIKPSSSTTTPSTTPVLRWNKSGITVAGITGQSGNTSNLFNLPYGLAMDFSNTLYIADRYNNRVQKWPMNSLTGSIIAGHSNGTRGSSASGLYLPTDLAVDSSGNVYIVDTWNLRIQLWKNGSSQGSTIAGVGGTPNITLGGLYGLARDPNLGTLYIADTYNYRVVSYRIGELAGTVVAGGNGQGRNITQLSTPAGLYFDSTSNSLLIANNGAHNIVQWVIGASSWTLVAGNFNGTAGSTSTGLTAPFDFTLDPMGNVYVADSGNNRIQFFLAGQSTGTTIAGLAGASGSNSTRLSTPDSLALDSQLNLYVADTYNQQIQKLLRY